MSAFEALPWHGAQWQQIVASRASGRLAHAFLLAGPRGIGKQRFAMRMAALLLCEASSAVAPCGNCRGCKLLTAGSHPNLRVVQPAEDKRDIAVDDIRELCERLALTAHYGGAKVALIQPADALNANGVNALLKTIEEPPSNSYLLLLTDRPMLLAATLRSRCQFVRFGVPTRAEGLAWLKSQNPAASEAVLESAHGAPLKAMELLADGALQRHAQWQQGLRAIWTGQGSPLAIASGMDKATATAFIEWLMTWAVTRQKAVLAGSAQAGPDAACLDALLQDCVQALQRLQGNAPPQLAVESIMIGFWQSGRSTIREMRA